MTAHLQEHLKRKHGKPEHGKPELGRRILHSTRTRDDWMTFLGVPKEGRLFKRSDNGEFKYATTEQGYQEWCINPSRRWLSKERALGLRLYIQDKRAYGEFKAKQWSMERSGRDYFGRPLSDPNPPDDIG